MASLFAALGRFAYRRRRAIVALWLLAFVPALVATTHLPGRLKGGGYTRDDSPAKRAEDLQRERLTLGTSTVTLVFSSDDLPATGTRFQALQERALARVSPETLPGLARVDTATSTGWSDLVSDDGHASLALLEFDLSLEATQELLPKLRELIAPTELDVAVTGDAAVYADVERISARDLRVAESYALPIAVIVLFFVFGSLVAASLPVLGGGISVTVTLGIVYLIAGVTDLSIFVMNVATLIGLAVGIDYSLLMVGRFRQELAAGRDVAGAVEATTERAGRAIFFSGLAVVVGFLGLFIVGTLPLVSIALGGALVVFVSVAVALTLLPALLGIIGPRVEAGRLWRPRRGEGRFWRRWSAAVMDHAGIVVLCSTALVLVIAAPALEMALDVPSAASLPVTAESRRGYEELSGRFDAGVVGPTVVILTWGAGGAGADPFTPANLERAWEYGARLAALPGVARVRSVVTVPGATSPAATVELWRELRSGESGPSDDERDAAAGGNPVPGAGQLITGLWADSARTSALRLAEMTTAPGTLLYLVTPEADPASPDARAVVGTIEDLAAPAGTEAHIGGLTAGVRDYLDNFDERFPWAVAFVVLATLPVLLLALRSVVLPVKAILVNTLSVLAAYGVLVVVFQWGHLEWLLGFDAVGTVDADVPVLLFCGLFGLSMDYEVFLLTRMREVWLTTGDNRRAVAEGLAGTGRVITGAALIVVVVAASFAFTSVIVTKAMGVGMAVAIALDATIIRILLVPALMRLFGRWNWWLPAWLDRWLPHIGEQRP